MNTTTKEVPRHTPEPWNVDPDFICDVMAGDKKVLTAWSEEEVGATLKVADVPMPTAEEQEANAERIVACVNACKGIPLEVLENAEVNELVTALTELLNTGLNGGNNVRMALLAASRMPLSEDDLAIADKSEQALNNARAVLEKWTNW